MGPIATKKPKKRPKNWAQTIKNKLARAQSNNCMPFAQPWFNQPYLSCFNSELQSVWSTGFLTSWASKPYVVSLKKLMGGSPYFELKSALLYCYALCTALLQSVISPSFQLRIVICLKSWIFDFLRLKNYVVCPKNLIGGSPDFELKSASLCCHAICAA